MSLNKVNLGAVVQIVMGQAPASEDCNKEGRGIPFVKVGEFGDERPIIREWTTDPKKLAKRTDVLLCVVGATCGKINLGEDCAIGRSVAAIRPIENKILQSYLHYFMKGKVEEMRVGSKGAAQTVISKDMINAVKIPLPSIDEQKRIVEILDEAFEGIDAAIANTEKNLVNARELFESFLNNIFKEKDDDWITEPLSKNVKFIDYRGKTPPKTESGIRLITAKNVKMGFINRVPEEFMDEDAYPTWMTRGFPKKGDVLFTTEAPLGMVAQLDTDETVVIGQRLITMQACPSVIDHKFLKYMLMSKSLQDEIHARGTGATVLGIKAQLLKTIPIYFPKDVSRQKGIADKIEFLENSCKSVEVMCKKKISSLKELKQSLLKKAFRGELTSSDKELAEVAA